MRIPQYIFLMLTLGVFLSGYGMKSTQKAVSIPGINIDNIETRDVNLSELVDSYDIVPLENKTGSLLNKPQGFAVSNQYILITDWEQYPAKLFTKTGKFICDIGKIGHGPDEYLSVVSPQIDDTNHTFWLLRGGNYLNGKDGWVYAYSLNGQIIQKINTVINKDKHGNSNDILVYNKQILKPGNVGSRNMIEYKSLTEKKDIVIRNRVNPNYFTYTTNNSTIYPLNDKFILKIGESDTIYSFSPKSGKVVPLTAIYTKRHRFDENRIKEARKTNGDNRFENIKKATKGGYSIQLLGETNRYYLLSVTIMDPEPIKKLLLIDKTTHKAFFGQIKNDFQNGLTMESIPYFYQNKYIIFHYPAIVYLNDLKQQAQKISNDKDLSSIKKINDKIKETDNDILLICKLKL